MRKTIAGLLAAATLTGSLIFAGTANAAPAVNVPGTTVNICAFVSLRDLNRVILQLNTALELDNKAIIQQPGLVILDVLARVDLNKLGLSNPASRQDVVDLVAKLQLNAAEFNRLHDQCDPTVPTTVNPTPTTAPVTTSASPTTTISPTTVVIPDVIVETTTVRVPVITDYTVPRGSVNTGGA